MAATITSQIVQVNAIVTEAPTPSTLQRSGAIISFGGTSLTPGTYQYVGTLAAFLAISTGGNPLDKVATFFAQGNAVGVYILELGTQSSTSAAITALGAWIAANPGVFYAYETPLTWDVDGAQLASLAAEYDGPTGKTYFFVSTTLATISSYAGVKSVFATVEAPVLGANEYQSSAAFYNWLVNNPQLGAPVPPMAYRFLYGVTPWPLTNNQATINAILTAYGNIVLTGAEGGISNACLFKGTTMDGKQSMFWWAADWVQINGDLLLANAIINGSNENPPLYYNQSGINRLLAVIQSLLNTGISYGLLLAATPAAVSFADYTAANPGDYANGIYNGLSANVVTQNGFLTITFNVDFSQLVPTS